MPSHVQFVRAPPAHGFVKFGESTIYVEVKFCSIDDTPPHTIGILWAPDLFCVGKSHFNDSNYWGAIDYMMFALACERYDDLSIMDQSACTTLDEKKQCLRAHLAGILVVTEMRSNYFGNRFPLHQWCMSGKLHAVQGTFANGEFRDTSAHDKLACLPACYRIRSRASEYHVAGHSFDFWSDELHSSCSGQSHGLDGSANTDFSTNIIDLHILANFASTSSAAACGTDDGLVASANEGFSTDIISTSSAAACGAAERHPNDIANESEAECMVCLSRPPTFVLKACGHFGLCRCCWKWMCKEQFNRNESERGKLSPATLKTKQVANVAITCPICRQVSIAVHCNNYTETKYAV